MGGKESPKQYCDSALADKILFHCPPYKALSWRGFHDTSQKSERVVCYSTENKQRASFIILHTNENIERVLDDDDDEVY